MDRLVLGSVPRLTHCQFRFSSPSQSDRLTTRSIHGVIIEQSPSPRAILSGQTDFENRQRRVHAQRDDPVVACKDEPEHVDIVVRWSGFRLRHEFTSAVCHPLKFEMLRLLNHFRIISQVLGAEVSELRKRAKQIELSKESPDKAQLDQLHQYAAKAAEEQQQIRLESALTESAHKHALDYVSIQLAIRDREKLIEVICHHQPDLVTTSIREMVSVYDPIIRGLHKAVDLASGVTDLQNFLDDLIALSLIDKGSKAPELPTVQDFCRLLEKHQRSSHVFIHQALKNGKELSQWYHEYASHAVEQYKQEKTTVEVSDGKTAAGDFTKCLNDLVSMLSDDQQRHVLEQLNSHASFLDALARQSKERMDKTIHASLKPNNTAEPEIEGSPGMFLLKWQQFIDQTAITPGSGNGPPRTGKSGSVIDATSVDVDGDKPAMTYQEPFKGKNSSLEPPDVSLVIQLLEPDFKNELHKLASSKKGQ
ncbi:MAG: hypothetical protein Q9166_001122 [cf. Caloplaca sp. 2 TL-2023]